MNNKNDMTSLSSDELKRIVQLLWQPNESGEEPTVYAILDGARDKRIEAFHRQGQLKSSCLYEGELSYSMAIAAPYIMRLEKGHPQTNQIIQQGWGNSWGIFAISWPPATLIKVRHNCRKIARVKGPDGKNLIFRYYDPRVLRAYLPTCTIEEANSVFGHVTDFLMEGDNSDTVLRFRRTENGVVDVSESLPALSLKSEDAELQSSGIDPELDQIVESFTKQVGEDLVRQAIGLLKMEPLAHIDPNDHIRVGNCVKTALIPTEIFKLNFTSPEPLSKLALAVELWGREFPCEKWATSILSSEEFTTEEKVSELFRAKAFQDVGPEAIDFSAYCIIRFADRHPEWDYENQEIHVASQMGLKIAREHHITDLDSTYFCVEMVLISGLDFIEAPECQPMKAIFEDDTLTSIYKIDKSYHWLTENLDSLGVE